MSENNAITSIAALVNLCASNPSSNARYNIFPGTTPALEAEEEFNNIVSSCIKAISEPTKENIEDCDKKISDLIGKTNGAHRHQALTALFSTLVETTMLSSVTVLSKLDEVPNGERNRITNTYNDEKYCDTMRKMMLTMFISQLNMISFVNRCDEIL